MKKQFKMIGIIGAGQMGSGIAHVCALAGHDVYLLDVNKKLLDKAIATTTRTHARFPSPRIAMAQTNCAPRTRQV